MLLSAVLIVKDEHKNIRDCLEGLSFCDEIIVVDSGSADDTRAIAEAMGAKVYSHPFVNFASQKNFGIEKASGDWVLLVDADERVSEALACEIKKTLSKPSADQFFFLRENKLFGRWMRYGINKNDLQLRLARRGSARFRGLVHERIIPTGKKIALKNPLMHYSTESISGYMKKLNVYTSLEAGELKRRGAKASFFQMVWRPPAVFLHRIFWLQGMLDGMEGFFYGLLGAYYEFIRRVKYWESTMKKNGL